MEHTESATQADPVDPEVIHTNGDERADKKRLWATIAYFIFFLPLLTDQKDNTYVKFHVKQGLVLLISFIVQAVLAMIPIVGWIAAFFLWILNIVLLIVGVFNAATGKQKELPLIGKLAQHLKF